MPRQSKTTEHTLADRTLVIDNGAYTMKAGFATNSPNLETDCHEIPNCIAKSRDKRIWIGAQLEHCKDFGDMSFRRPIEKGYPVNWEAEKEIWQDSFFDNAAKLKCDPHETNLLLTEAPNCPVALQTNCDQIIFEELEFGAYNRCIGASLNAYNDIATLTGDPPHKDDHVALPIECLLVVDSGFSHSTVTPLFRGRPIHQAIRRLDMGGKFLTNYMKELVSIRQMDMTAETHVMTQVKEDICYVSNTFKADLERTWEGGTGNSRKLQDGEKGLAIDFVLPDYITYMKGFARPHDPSLVSKRNKYGAVLGPTGNMEHIVTLGNERFTVPELLFNPSDAGMKEAGLPETIMQSLSGLPPGLWPAMLSNVWIIGGNAKMEGFVERLSTELRQLAPAECVVRVVRAPDPIKSTWLGGSTLASDRSTLKEIMVTRQEYQEHGSAWLLKRFASGNLK